MAPVVVESALGVAAGASAGSAGSSWGVPLAEESPRQPWPTTIMDHRRVQSRALGRRTGRSKAPSTIARNWWVFSRGIAAIGCEQPHFLGRSSDSAGSPDLRSLGIWRSRIRASALVVLRGFDCPEFVVSRRLRATSRAAVFATRRSDPVSADRRGASPGWRANHSRVAHRSLPALDFVRSGSRQVQTA